MQSTKKQLLVPLTVEWQVSPTTPYLRLYAAESASDAPTSVTFVAHFGLIQSQNNEVGNNGESVIIATPPDTGQLSPEPGPYQQVRMIFHRGNWARICPSFSDMDVFDPSLYEYSSDIGDFNPGDSISNRIAKFRESWIRNSICPDPRIYEVKNSHWIRETNTELHDYHHYLIVGHDAYVEVLALGWEAMSEGTLLNW